MPQERRVSQNAEILREVNERIRELEEKWRSVDPIGFVCECSGVGCTTTVYMTVEEYERIRAAGHFLTAPTHIDLEHERAVVANENYAVVERLSESVPLSPSPAAGASSV